MKPMLALVLPMVVSACVVAPDVGSGNPNGNPNGNPGGKAGGDTAVVCHKGKKTLELPRSAAQAHLDHGDKPGPC